MNDLKMARFLKGISQAKLAKETGIDAAIISRLENDLLRDTPAVLLWKEKIAGILETPMEVLFPGTTKRENGR